jgi:uncharacterized protein
MRRGSSSAATSALLRSVQQRVLASGASAASGGSNVVAYSGGVDSSLVAAVVRQSFPTNSFACIGISAALPDIQKDIARRVAHHIGIELREVPTYEGEDAEYRANKGRSCLHCKTHLYDALRAVASQVGSSSSGAGGGQQRLNVLFNGTNRDDRKDPTRLGLIAADNYDVASPIDHLSKDEVRSLSRALGLPNWDHAASPCLRSRLAFGVEATTARLAAVEEAENVVRDILALKVCDNLRVRYMPGERAVIELDDTRVEEARHMSDQLLIKVKGLGFQTVEVASFKSGSLSGYSVASSA